MTSPAPYPADTRAKGWRFELDYEAIQQSDTWALADEIPMAQPALLMMWLTSWAQIPCGSLPDDEAVIRAKCKVPAKDWARMRDVLMRGWWKADDGRLYHPTITQRVLDMVSERSRGKYRRFRNAVVQRDGEGCRYCGAFNDDMTLDHVIPRSRGGPDDIGNLALACRPCNSSKGARTPQEWLAS